MGYIVLRNENKYGNRLKTTQEIFESATTIELDKQGEMMNETRFLQWATTERCPKMEHRKAQLTWDGWVSDPAGSGMLTGIESGFRVFRVPTKTMVNFKETLTQKKQVEMEGKSLKGKQITGEALAKLKACALTGHGAPEELDFQGRAGQMLQNSLGSSSGVGAFGDDGLMLGNITQLLGSKADEEDAAADDGDGDPVDPEDDDDDTVDPEEPAKKKAKYVNQGKLTLSSTREMEKALDPKSSELEVAVEKLSDLVSKIQKAPVASQAWHKNEIAFARPRLELAKACLASQASLDKVKQAMTTTAPVSSGATSSTYDAIEQAAPIATMQSLLSISATRAEIPDRVGRISSTEDKKNEMKEFKTKLVPLSDLIKSVNDATTTLESRSKDFTPVKASAKEPITVPVLNACAQAPEEAATATLDDIANLNPNRPALIKAFAHKLTNPDITKGFENWKKQWKSDVLSKGIGGRRTLEMSKPCEAAVQDFVRKEILGKCTHNIKVAHP